MARPTGTTRYFGIVSDATGITNGIIANSLTFNHNVETAEARGLSGQLIDIAAYSEREQVDIQGLYTGEQGIVPGQIISLGDKDYLVESNNITESNTNFKESSVTARRGDKETVLWPLSSFVSA